jgi:hypothetical protein
MHDPHPPKFWRDLLTLHQKFPPLFWRSGKTVKLWNPHTQEAVELEHRYRHTLLPRLCPLIRLRTIEDRVVAAVPQCDEGVSLLYTVTLGIELRKLGYDSRISPEDTDRYASIMKIAPSAWQEASDRFSRDWPCVNREMLHWGRSSYRKRSIRSWDNAHLQSLGPGERKALACIESLLHVPKGWPDITSVALADLERHIENQFESRKGHFLELAAAFRKAHRCGLHKHPFVQEWFNTLRNLGFRWCSIPRGAQIQG